MLVKDLWLALVINGKPMTNGISSTVVVDELAIDDDAVDEALISSIIIEDGVLLVKSDEDDDVTLTGVSSVDKLITSNSA